MSAIVIDSARRDLQRARIIRAHAAEYTTTAAEGYLGAQGYTGNHAGDARRDGAISDTLRAEFKRLGAKGVSFSKGRGHGLAVTVTAWPGDLVSYREFYLAATPDDFTASGYIEDPEHLLPRCSVAAFYNLPALDRRRIMRALTRTLYKSAAAGHVFPGRPGSDDATRKLFSPEFLAWADFIRAVVTSYNFNHGNSQVDYYDVGFYADYHMKPAPSLADSIIIPADPDAPAVPLADLVRQREAEQAARIQAAEAPAARRPSELDEIAEFVAEAAAAAADPAPEKPAAPEAPAEDPDQLAPAAALLPADPARPAVLQQVDLADVSADAAAVLGTAEALAPEAAAADPEEAAALEPWPALPLPPSGPVALEAVAAWLAVSRAARAAAGVS